MPDLSVRMMFYRFLALFSALLLFHDIANARLLSFGNGINATGNIPFTAQHTYFIAPNGLDTNNGTSAGTPWLTPHGHSLVCGDVIIAAAGTYTSTNFLVPGVAGASPWWSVPTGCPSSTLGIDGLGQIYAAAIVCATAFACNTSEMWVDSSNWVISGFVCNDASTNLSVCFRATPSVTGTSINYVAFINDVCTGSALGCFYGGGAGFVSGSVDEFAMIGVVAFGGPPTSSECGSNLSINTPVNVDALAGTHIQVSGTYSYGGIDGLCGANSNSQGAFSTDNGGTGSGSPTVVVASSTGMLAGYPVGVQNGQGIIIAGISQPNWITNVAGATLTLNTATSGTISNGASIGAGTTSDGEGLIFDTWNSNAYARAAYVSQNLFWGNGGHGMVLLCTSACNSGLKITVDHNTSYGNLQDYKHGGAGAELNYNTGASFPGTLNLTNNIIQASLITPLNSPSIYKNVPTTGNGLGNPVVSGILNPGYTVSGNFFKSAASATAITGAVMDGAGNNVAYFNGASYASGNTFGTDAGFSSPGSLPTTAPNCSGQTNVYQCMVAAGVISALTPSGSAASLGYQPPTTVCAANSNYATWLKGLVYLSWNGSVLTENSGLVNKPCGT